jgi:flagellar biosynthesis GTPase FlhF
VEATLIDRLVAHCTGARFTGILRIRAHEGIGEVWFLSGVADEVRFGTSTADEAMDRMRQATEATFELVSRLPHPAGGFKTRFPSKGSVVTATPVTLMRYCERYALTCTLAVESNDVLVEATYELGELVGVETTADDDGITAMLEAQQGTYEFTLPRVELPAGTPVLPPAPSLLESMPPESLGFRAFLEAKPNVGRPASDEAEVKRKTVEIAHRQKKEQATTPSAPRPAAASKPVPDIREAERGAAKALAQVADEKREAEKREAERRATEKRETEKLEAEKREAEKLEAEKLEAEKLEAEKLEAEKLEAEKLEAEKPEAEERGAEDRAETPLKKDEPSEPARPAKVPTTTLPWAWFVLSLLVAAALGYLFWTHRI